MNETTERTCADCSSFFPDTFDWTEFGICLNDEAFEPYLEELLEHGNYDVCRELIEQKKFSGEKACCPLFEKEERIELPPDWTLQDVLDIFASHKGKSSHRPPEYSFKDYSFSRLMEISEPLRELREEYRNRQPEERRMAADFTYHEALAGQLFNDAVGEHRDPAPVPGEVATLAIDPKYAPAVLTVGTYEYIHGRIDEAQELLLSLVNLPEDKEDLLVIIDTAGQFLIDRKNYRNALALYAAAAKKFPGEQVFRDGVAYCSDEMQNKE